jgi:hypothetical protein
MKGDFSRFTFAPGKQYTRVLMQRGRVSLDSDWNEQAAIDAHLQRARFVDVVGCAGVPARQAFAVRARGDGLELTPGRLYVHGLLCELHAPMLLGFVASPGRTDLVYVDAWERHVTALQDLDLLEPALAGADTTTRLQVAWNVDVVEGVGDVLPADATPFLPRPPTGTLRASASPYAGAENHLYRVEIHDGGGLGEATFKWSRDNGSVVFAIDETISAPTLAVVPFPRNAGHALCVGDCVEVSGDDSERAGRVGLLARVEKVEPGVVVLDRDASAQAAEPHAFLRRWEGSAPVSSGPIELGDGICVTFGSGDFRSGDYWTIPARPGIPIDWPDAEHPHGVDHRVCALALVTWRKDAAVVRDCRRMFSPLTEVEDELARLRREVADLRRRLDDA